MRPGVHVHPASPIVAWTTGLADLWGFGIPLSHPADDAVGFGAAAEAAALAANVASGRLAGGVVTVGPDEALPAGLPMHRTEMGSVRFGESSVQGIHVLFDSGKAVATSSAGVHAVEHSGLLILGIDPQRSWGRVDGFWAYEAIAEYLSARGSPILPRACGIGLLRLDDTPGTAQHQIEGRAKPDRRQYRRIERTVRKFERAGAKLNVAVASEAFAGEDRVPLDQVWPRSIAAWRRGVERGAVEPVCHGVLHLDDEALAAGQVEFREFARLNAAEAGRRIDSALAWQRENLGRPSTFAAPAWSYGEAGDSEAAGRGLIRWHRPRPGPLLDGGRLHESLFGALPGLDGLDFSPLRRLAAVGIPPIVALHGALIDSRLDTVRKDRDPVLLMRLFWRRDIERLIGLSGVRWVSAAELVGTLAAGEARECA
jgi:hypothetical protein